jgi:hypothetical protein
MTRASVFVSCGAPDQCTGGLTPPPWQVYLAGIVPRTTTGLVTVMMSGASPCKSAGPPTRPQPASKATITGPATPIAARRPRRAGLTCEASLASGASLPRDAKLASGASLPRDANLARGAGLPRDANLARGAGLPRDANLARGADLPRDAKLASGASLPSDADLAHGASPARRAPSGRRASPASHARPRPHLYTSPASLRACSAPPGQPGH